MGQNDQSVCALLSSVICTLQPLEVPIDGLAQTPPRTTKWFQWGGERERERERAQKKTLHIVRIENQRSQCLGVSLSCTLVAATSFFFFFFLSLSLSLWGFVLTVVHKLACKPHRRDSVFWDLIISHTFIVWPVPLYLISRTVSKSCCVPVPLSTGPVPELGFGCRVTVTHGTVTRWDWHNETVTLSVPVLILSWDCYSMRLWHNECYSVCPIPDFVMALLLRGTVTQWDRYPVCPTSDFVMGMIPGGTVTQWDCYPVCPSPDFFMGLLLDGTVTQCVLLCLSQSWFCHGTAARWDWHNETVTLSVPLLILSWDC